MTDTCVTSGLPIANPTNRAIAPIGMSRTSSASTVENRHHDAQQQQLRA